MPNKVDAHSPNLADQQWRRYIRARDAGHTEYVKRRTKYENYYLGEQWEEAVRKELEEEGRPALTINLILSTINVALGDYVNKQAVMTYKPGRHGTHEVAQVLNKLVAHILAENDYASKEFDVFSDGIIGDRGYFEVLVDFSENINGEIRLHARDASEIVLDPDAKEYDPATWNEVIRTYWETLDGIEADFGRDKRDEVAHLVTSGSYYAYDSFEFDRQGFGDSSPASWEFDHTAPEDRNIKSVRVISRQYKRLVKTRFFVDLQTGDRQPVPQTWDEERVNAFAEQFGLALTERTVPRIRWTVTADHVVLHDDWSPYQTFSIIPFFPYFLRGRAFGMVKNLIDPQDHLNKSTSQELHVINTTANSGWTVEEGTLVNMTEDEFAERGAETGLVLVHAKGSAPPQKIQPNQIPTGLELVSNKSRTFLREISGLEGILSVASPEISGVALDRKSGLASVQMQVPALNLERTRTLLARKLLELIQQFYTETRIIQITRDVEDPENPTEELAINQPTPEGLIANDVTQGKYSVVISTAPRRDTFDDVQFAEIMQMREVGINIPDDIAVRYSRIADREEAANRIRQLMGQAEPTPEELEMMEIQQQLQMMALQGELDKLIAEAEEIRSRTALNLAKTEQLAGGELSPEHTRKLADIEARIQSKREELALRERLAMLSAHNRDRESSTKAALSLAQTQYQGETQKELAWIYAQRPQAKGK